MEDSGREAGGSREPWPEPLAGLRWEITVAGTRVGGAAPEGLVKVGPGGGWGDQPERVGRNWKPRL